MYGLGNSIPLERLIHTDVFINFDLIHRSLTGELKSSDDESYLRSNYKPIRLVLKKSKNGSEPSKNIKNKENIVILRPEKANGVSLMDKIKYKQKIYESLNGESKLKQLSSDPTEPA